MTQKMTAAKPLFNIEKRPRIFGIAGTILFWALFIVLSTIFSLFARKPVYKTVQIHLDSPQPKTQESRAAASPKAPVAELAQAPASSAPAQAQSTQKQVSTGSAGGGKAAQKQNSQKQVSTGSTSGGKTAQKQSSQKQVSTKSASEPFETDFYDPMEQFLKNTAQSNTNKNGKEIDWDSVEMNSSSSPSTKTQTNAVQNALSGSAGTAHTNTDTSASASSAGKKGSTAASEGTTSALKAIAATQYTEISGNGVSSTTTVQTGGTADGKVTVQMSDGTSRALLEPASPSITLSPAAATLIDGKKQVQIRFTVTATGTVPVTDIRITPESILHPIVRSEITTQISRWRFSSAANAGTAMFDYTISVK